METQTLAIALTSIIASTFTVFLSNFLAPRINAKYERRYQQSLVLKKTLRILMEIEIYVQRNLKHPSIGYYTEPVVSKLEELKQVTGEEATSLSAQFPQLLQMLQPHLVGKLPDRSEALDREFTLIISELSTVDPLMAYRISDRHLIKPIQQLEGIVFDSLRSLGLAITEDNLEVQVLRQLIQSERNTMIDELLSDLRKDILRVAGKIGRKDREEIELYFAEREDNRRKEGLRFAQEVGKYVPRKNKSVAAETADSSTTT